MFTSKSETKNKAAAQTVANPKRAEKMSLKMELGRGKGGSGGKAAIKKQKLPQKTSMNLMVQETMGASSKTSIIAFVIFIILLAVFVKFGVVNQITKANKAENAYETMQSDIASLQESNKDYDKVRAEYSHYGNGYLTDDEKLSQDVMDILGVVDNHVLKQSSIDSVTIGNNLAMITISNTTLTSVSKIVADLEDVDSVSYVDVATAGTGQDSATKAVTATLTINFKDAGGDQ